ncbi:hypothetical protein SAXI111661_09900 [Saccharomonospora xinjiangensis]|uniref:hypothetical protein n=1 Tax=Saccharomonospora xinjiangensis TaxID=75294 RepID=UPI00106FC330|nr:hypothetical protein [Saccharomonospora xinjiangensis]QBQ59981.1 hypothetical protein EYD13_08100 [Saccharomonospora xinjiangensis]
MRSAISDPIVLPLLFGLVGGVVTATKQGWWGLLAGVVVAAAVHASMVLTTAVLDRAGREASRAAPEPSPTEHDYFVRCLRAVRTLPPHETDLSPELNDLLLAVEQAKAARDGELTVAGLDALRKTAEQLENIDTTASIGQIEYRLRRIRESLRNILDGMGDEPALR